MQEVIALAVTVLRVLNRRLYGFCQQIQLSVHLGAFLSKAGDKSIVAGF